MRLQTTKGTKMPNGLTSNKMPFIIPNTTIFSLSRERGGSTYDYTGGEKPMSKAPTLEWIADRMIKINKAQEPRDIEIDPRRVVISLTERSAKMHIMGGKGQDAQPIYFTNSGLAQALEGSRYSTSLVKGLVEDAQDDSSLKSHSLSICKNLVDRAERKIRESKKDDVDVTRKYRTVRTRHNGQVIRICYAVTSIGYAKYDAVELFTDLASIDVFKDMLCIDVRLDRNFVRARFIEQEITDELLNVPVPMYDATSGFAKNARVSLLAMIYKLWCTNGCGSTKTTKTNSWIHYGSASRIKEELIEALTGEKSAAKKMIDTYKEALNLSIDKEFDKFFDAFVKPNVTQTVADRVLKNMTHETTTPNRKLASIVDSITLTAQEHGIEQQRMLEDLGAQILFTPEARIRELVEV